MCGFNVDEPAVYWESAGRESPADEEAIEEGKSSEGEVCKPQGFTLETSF